MKLKIIFACMVLLVLPGCLSERDALHDGYYTARHSGYNRDGWQGFITLYVQNDKIITVEFNARNPSGLVLSWDVHYLSRLKAATGVHPNQIIRGYTNELLNRQDPAHIRPAKGDAFFYDSFIELSSAALLQAERGDKTVAVIHPAEAGPGLKP